MDKLLIATAQEGQVRIIATETTELVNVGVKLHNCTPTAAAALGRLLTAGALMGAMLKSEKDSLTIQMSGGGKAKGVVVTAYANSIVKGYIGDPTIEIPANEKGKLDVGGAIGTEGSLVVIRDMGLKEPYIGQVPIQSGEIGEDLAYYFTVSEQTPSAVALGVLVDVDHSIKAAGGFIIQMLPGASDLVADLITYRLQEVPAITELIKEGKSIEDILNYIFEDMGLKIAGEIIPQYRCDCSRDRIERALLSVGLKDLHEIYEEGKSEEIQCHFCNKAYVFTNEDIGSIIETLGRT